MATTSDSRSAEQPFDPDKRPERTVVMVDLGPGVMRVEKRWYWNNEDKQWTAHATLTLMTPAWCGEHYFEPAASVSAALNPAQCAALIEALS